MRQKRNFSGRQFEFAARSDDVGEIYDDRFVQIRKLCQLLRCVEGRALVTELDVPHLAAGPSCSCCRER